MLGEADETSEVEDDDVYNSDDDANDGTGSVYYDSDELGSYYSETDDECGDEALRSHTSRIRFDPESPTPIFFVLV